jgi:hypothetical protein
VVLATAWATIGNIASVVAALAAAVAILFAKRTVDEARASRREANDAHEHLLASHRQQLEASSAAHREEMAQRAQALASERKLEVLRQLQQIASVLVNLADGARDEAINPPARLSEISPIPLTCITGILAALRATTASLDALRGPDLPQVRRVASQSFSPGTPPMHFVGEAFMALSEVENAISAFD